LHHHQFGFVISIFQPQPNKIQLLVFFTDAWLNISITYKKKMHGLCNAGPSSNVNGAAPAARRVLSSLNNSTPSNNNNNNNEACRVPPLTTNPASNSTTVNSLASTVGSVTASMIGHNSSRDATVPPSAAAGDKPAVVTNRSSFAENGEQQLPTTPMNNSTNKNSLILGKLYAVPSSAATAPTDNDHLQSKIQKIKEQVNNSVNNAEFARTEIEMPRPMTVQSMTRQLSTSTAPGSQQPTASNQSLLGKAGADEKKIDVQSGIVNRAKEGLQQQQQQQVQQKANAVAAGGPQANAANKLDSLDFNMDPSQIASRVLNRPLTIKDLDFTAL
jgi:hypothetical protein